MKFLLTAVNAKYIHSNPAIYSLRSFAAAKEPAFAEMIELAEYTVNQEMNEILADLYRRKPDVIGFSCYIWNWRLVRELAGELHKLLPDTPIWLGGPEVSHEPQEALRALPFAAGIMVGEGEETFFDLMRYYAAKGEAEEDSGLSDIPGLYLQSGSTGTRQPADLSAIPFLYDEKDCFENRIIYYETSRGCPFCCSYCLSSVEKSVRFRNIEMVKRELKFFLEQKAAQVKLVDRTFNAGHEHAMEIWRFIKENDNGVTNFHFEIEAELLTEEELTFLQTLRPGLIQMEIGVQSANPQTLAAVHRSAKIDRIEAAVKRLNAGHNIHVHLDLIAGLPHEDYQSFRQSFNTVYAMRPSQLQLGFLKVLKGSGMYEDAKRYGIGYRDEPPYEVLFTDWLSYEEIVRLKRVEEMVEIYYNSNQFTHTLPVLERAFPDAFSMYEALAEDYERQGYLLHTPSRASRYERLLRFAANRCPEQEELFRELLTYDMYLRENLKARTDFMQELSPWYGKIQEFYESEERAPRLLKDYEGCHARQLMRLTHVEPFFYPVWDTQAAMEKQDTPSFLLFDYRTRDALTGNAATVKL